MALPSFTPQPPAAAMRRRWELDALRGLMLVLMTSTHLPTWFAVPASQPFGFVSAAEGFVFRGSERYLPADGTPVDSPAARDLARKALNTPDDEVLYVVGIGAITNVASAILMEPKIIEKIVVVWLGGHALDWRDTKEFNLIQDVPAARTVLDCGVPLVLVPCHRVTSHLITTLPEINHYVRGKGPIGDFLAQRYEECSEDHYAYSRVIWDISVIAWLIEADFMPSDLVHSPVLTDQVTWSRDTSRHWIRIAYYADRNRVFKDLFSKLERHAAGGEHP